MEGLREEFYKDDKNRLAQNVVSRSDPLETCMSRICIEETQHVFNNKVDEVKPRNIEIKFPFLACYYFLEKLCQIAFQFIG